MIERGDSRCDRMVRLQCMHAAVYHTPCSFSLTASGKKKKRIILIFFQKTKTAVLCACAIFMVFLIVETGCAPKVNTVLKMSLSYERVNFWWNNTYFPSVTCGIKPYWEAGAHNQCYTSNDAVYIYIQKLVLWTMLIWTKTLKPLIFKLS